MAERKPISVPDSRFTCAASQRNADIQLGVSAGKFCDVLQVIDFARRTHLGNADVDARRQAADLEGILPALEGENAQDIQAKTNTLAQAAMKLGEAMYQSQQGQADAADAQPADDGVVDAEFEDVTDDEDADKKEQA